MAEVQIVVANTILDVNNRLQENLRSYDIFTVFSNDREGINWLARRKLVGNSYICANCNVQCNLQRRNQCVDGYVWKCTTYVQKNKIDPA